MSNLVPVQDIERMAVAVAKSNLFGVKTSEQAMALMLIAQAEGLHPAIAARDYHVIQGRPALKSDAMLARFQTSGGKVEWLDYTDTKVSAKFSHAQGGTVTISWTIEQAKAAGLTNKDNWKQYPRQMLRARVISEGVRTVFPSVVVGVYTPEEIQDFGAKPEAKEVESTVLATGSDCVATTDHAPVAQGKVVEQESSVPSQPTQKETDPAKAVFYAQLKQSKWSKNDLSTFSQEIFGKSDARALSLAELMRLANAANNFESASEALKAEAK